MIDSDSLAIVACLIPIALHEFLRLFTWFKTVDVSKMFPGFYPSPTKRSTSCEKVYYHQGQFLKKPSPFRISRKVPATLTKFAPEIDARPARNAHGERAEFDSLFQLVSKAQHAKAGVTVE